MIPLTSVFPLQQFLHYIKHRATSIEYTAGMNGSREDGGASVIRSQVEAYTAGMNNYLPDIWETYYREFMNEANDYQLYLKLHEKFGGE